MRLRRYDSGNGDGQSSKGHTGCQKRRARPSMSPLALTLLSAPTPLQEAQGSVAVNRSSVAALAFLVWDILITLDEEIRLMWPRKWAPSKILYFFVRYFPVSLEIAILFVGTTFTYSPHACFIWQAFQGASTVAITMAVDLILILRLHALYHGNLIVQRILWLFYVFEIAGMVVGLALALPGIEFNDVCLVTFMPTTILIYGAASVIFQMILFIFTAVKFIGALRSGWGRIPIVSLIMRDGTWAFFVIFAVIVGQASIYLAPNGAFAGVLFGWLATVFAFCGYRIMLNISHLSSPEPQGTIASMAFTTGPLVEGQGSAATVSASYEMSPLSSSGKVESQRPIRQMDSS